jgi:DHA1 family bicyclomycin/chloramphenicol resistance-like MFS transporter
VTRGRRLGVWRRPDVQEPSQGHEPAKSGVSRALGAVLSALVIFGPISMDLYLPALPALTTDLEAPASLGQLTLSACLLGLAGGQLVAGPLSDRLGRRTLLLWGIGVYIVSSLVCAAAPTIDALIVARLAQGLAGSVGLVVAMAAGRDLFEGPVLLGYYGRLTVISGTAAIVGPVIGGQLANFTDWRGIFVFLAGLGLLILIAAWIWGDETLPTDRRLATDSRLIDGFKLLRSDRTFVAMVLGIGFSTSAIFAYLAGATYVLQGTYGLSPQGYSYAFAGNSLSFVLCGVLASRIARTRSPFATLLTGLVMCVCGASSVLVVGLLHLPLPAVLASLATMVGGVAVIAPPATTLALERYPDIAGTASSILGTSKFLFGAVTAPLIGVGGGVSAVSLGTVTTAAMVMAAACIIVGHRPMDTLSAQRTRRTSTTV